MTKRPIGVFDSGVGGLSVLRAVRAELPREDLLYVADSGHAPYGERSEDFILERVKQITAFMRSRRVKAVVSACNTATMVALQWLRNHLEIPVVAIEPMLQPAIERTRSGRVGILATRVTLMSEGFSSLLVRHQDQAEFFLQPCPRFVELVERGALDGPETRQAIRDYIEPLFRQGVDTLVLGCTHFPFLIPIIQEIAGPEVAVIEPSRALARELRLRLTDSRLLTDKPEPGATFFWTSGEPRQVEPVISRLWGAKVQVQALPQRYAIPPDVNRTAHSTPNRS